MVSRWLWPGRLAQASPPQPPLSLFGHSRPHRRCDTPQTIGDAFIVEPGYPRICLWPDSVKQLLGSPDALPLLTPNWDKRYLPLDGICAHFEPHPKPLGVIYLFSSRCTDADTPRIEPLDKRDALLGLVQNTYMNYILNRDQRAAELDFLAKIVAQVPVRRITPHADPARLDTLCDLILQNAADLSPQGQTYAPLATP